MPRNRRQELGERVVVRIPADADFNDPIGRHLESRETIGQHEVFLKCMDVFYPNESTDLDPEVDERNIVTVAFCVNQLVGLIYRKIWTVRHAANRTIRHGEATELRDLLESTQSFASLNSQVAARLGSEDCEDIGNYVCRVLKFNLTDAIAIAGPANPVRNDRGIVGTEHPQD